MAALVGLRGQFYKDPLFDASGTIANVSVAQLIVPLANSRTSLYLQNNSTSPMYFEFGPARASATLTNGAVSAVNVTNAGFGYSLPPTVTFLSGSWGSSGSPIATPTYSTVGLPDYASPSNVAQAHCVMSGSAPNMSVGSIVIDNPGAAYAYPPKVILTNNPLDPYGCAAPSTNAGITLAAGSPPLIFNGSLCPTDQISVFCSAANVNFACKYTL